MHESERSERTAQAGQTPILSAEPQEDFTYPQYFVTVAVCPWRSKMPCSTNVLVFHDYRKLAATVHILTSDSQP
ncbi:MAG: hypothetical protein WA655_16140 [Candidatus Korobacteraceae bacterium]